MSRKSPKYPALLGSLLQCSIVLMMEKVLLRVSIQSESLFQFVTLFPLCEEHAVVVLKTSSCSWDSLVQGNCFPLFAHEWLLVFCLILDKSRTDLEQVPKVWLLCTLSCCKASSHEVLNICMYSVLCRNFVLADDLGWFSRGSVVLRIWKD